MHKIKTQSLKWDKMTVSENLKLSYDRPRLVVKDDFLAGDYLRELEHVVNQGVSRRLDDTQNHVMKYTRYAWNIIHCELRKSPIRYQLLSELSKIYQQNVPVEDLNPVQLFAKEFDENSFCAPHAEDPKLYGPWVFMLYLSNEEDGALCLNGVRILPRRNRLVAMKTGVEHWAEKCSSRRLNITGWSYASLEVVRRWKTPHRNSK